MESLKKNEDFRRCYRKGKSCANRYLVLYVCGNGTDHNRIGISVSKKVGNSVVRHRICRLVRESYRLQEDRFSSGLDLAVVARTAANEAEFADIRDALMDLAGRSGLLTCNTPAEKKPNGEENSDCDDQVLP